MLRQYFRRFVLAWIEVQPHNSLVGSFYGVELSLFVRSALLGVHAVLDLGDRRRTAAEYPHATVALVHELAQKAGERARNLHTRDYGLDFSLRRNTACLGLSPRLPGNRRPVEEGHHSRSGLGACEWEVGIKSPDGLIEVAV